MAAAEYNYHFFIYIYIYIYIYIIVLYIYNIYMMCKTNMIRKYLSQFFYLQSSLWQIFNYKSRKNT